MIDTDDSGSLTKDELYEMLVQLEVVMPNKRVFMICEPDAVRHGAALRGAKGSGGSKPW